MQIAFDWVKFAYFLYRFAAKLKSSADREKLQSAILGLFPGGRSFHHEPRLDEDGRPLLGDTCYCNMCTCLRRREEKRAGIENFRAAFYGEAATLSDGNGRETQGLVNVSAGRHGGSSSNYYREGAIDDLAEMNERMRDRIQNLTPAIKSIIASLGFGHLVMASEAAGPPLNTKCHVCHDPNVDKINEMLVGGQTSRDIADWLEDLAHKNGGAVHSKSAINRHDRQCRREVGQEFGTTTPSGESDSLQSSPVCYN